MRFNKPTLVLFCGPPGSGKTTLAKDLEVRGHGLRICTDDWQESLSIDHSDGGFHERLQTRLYRHALQLLEHGQDVILEDGLWMKAERDEKLADARRSGARAVLHLYDLTFEQLWTRTNNRNSQGIEGAVRIDRSHLERIWSVFEKPDPSELALFDSYEIHTAVAGSRDTERTAT